MPWNPEYYMKKAEVIKILEDNKITNVTPQEKMICPNCKGNGFTRHTFEAEKSELPCQACHSEGEVPVDKFFSQTYEEKNWLQEGAPIYYHGPCLDYTLFRKLRIILNDATHEIK